MILQLSPTIYVDTPLGKGHCIFIIDYGMHQNSCWIIVLEKDRFMGLLFSSPFFILNSAFCRYFY